MAVFNSGHILTAADFDTILPTGITAWTDYTPTWTQNVAITKTVNYARYAQVGKTVVGSVWMTASSTGTANNQVRVSLPVTADAATVGKIVGAFFLLDASVPLIYVGAAFIITTTVVHFAVSGTTANVGATGGGFTAAIASSDDIRFDFCYEAA